ncbi:MAG TPA: hypothetical protein VJW55_15265 [Candidatus Angelobacter sp.]|nr:hypothetical protein [Candidatus Angelobacter sp.]
MPIEIFVANFGNTFANCFLPPACDKSETSQIIFFPANVFQQSFEQLRTKGLSRMVMDDDAIPSGWVNKWDERTITLVAPPTIAFQR